MRCCGACRLQHMQPHLPDGHLLTLSTPLLCNGRSWQSGMHATRRGLGTSSSCAPAASRQKRCWPSSRAGELIFAAASLLPPSLSFCLSYLCWHQQCLSRVRCFRVVFGAPTGTGEGTSPEGWVGRHGGQHRRMQGGRHLRGRQPALQPLQQGVQGGLPARRGRHKRQCEAAAQATMHGAQSRHGLGG